MTLTKVRDTGMNSYTWFWIDDNKKIVSPYFDSEEEAKQFFNVPEKKEEPVMPGPDLPPDLPPEIRSRILASIPPQNLNS